VSWGGGTGRSVSSSPSCQRSNEGARASRGSRRCECDPCGAARIRDRRGASWLIRKQFLTLRRATPERQAVEYRVRHWREFYGPVPEDAVRTQAARCMTVEFHSVRAIRAVQCEMSSPNRTASCSAATGATRSSRCMRQTIFRSLPSLVSRALRVGVRARAGERARSRSGTSRQTIADRGFNEGWLAASTAARVGVQGCRDRNRPRGPRAAQQLRRAGHAVVVFERMSASAGCFATEFPSQVGEIGARTRLPSSGGRRSSTDFSNLNSGIP